MAGSSRALFPRFFSVSRAKFFSMCGSLQGTTKKRAFPNFEMKQCRTETFAREHLEKFGVPHLWDMVLTDTFVEESGPFLT